MRSVLGIAVAAMVLAGSSAWGSPTARSDKDPVWSPNGKLIAFVGTRGGDEELYVMNRDGSDVRRLTRDARFKERIAWSPDGRWIAYTASPGTIEAVSPDGRRRRRLASCCVSQPDFSPVIGHEVAYVNQNPAPAVWVMDSRGLRRRVVEAPKDDEALIAPTWSPSGQLIAFAVGAREHGEGVSPHLGIVSRRGGARTKVLIGRSIWSIDWSPDGRRILFVEKTAGDQHRIAVLNLRTRRVGVVRRIASMFWERWSPNGREIVFADQGRIFVMKSDGTHVRRLVPRP